MRILEQLSNLFGATVVGRLPKTRSGKMLRNTIKCIADNTPYRMPATIDDPDTLTQMKVAMAKLGFGESLP